MPLVHLLGHMTCPPERRDTVRAALPEHLRLTRAEPGCLEFDVIETEPGLFQVSELFVSRTAFDAHQDRMRASAWFTVTEGLVRDYTITER